MAKFSLVNGEIKIHQQNTAQQKLDSKKQALKTSFAEPPEVQRRRLASECSTMKQRATESIDCFAYRFKSNLHRLSKLGDLSKAIRHSSSCHNLYPRRKPTSKNI